ncbi:Nitronate monooxygenase [Variovorax sp. CF079]|nr:Nitronate monooxygenase [Variovorax sp. CF079]
MISTRFTRMLDIRHPVVLAGLGGVGRAELAAAVSNAGGLGMLGMIRMSPDFIRDQIRRTRALTSRPFGVNLVPPCAPAPGGAEAQFEVCLEERVPVLSLFWCDAAPFVSRCHAAGIIVILQVGSAGEARNAAVADVDVIVAQGIEAGGHVRGQWGCWPCCQRSSRQSHPGRSSQQAELRTAAALLRRFRSGPKASGSAPASSPVTNAPRTPNTSGGCSRLGRQTLSTVTSRAFHGPPAFRIACSKARSPKVARHPPDRLRETYSVTSPSTCSHSQARLRRSKRWVVRNSCPTMQVRGWASSTKSFPQRQSWSK